MQNSVLFHFSFVEVYKFFGKILQKKGMEDQFLFYLDILSFYSFYLFVKKR